MSVRLDPVRLARVALAWLARDGDLRVHRLARSYGPEGALDRLLSGEEPDIRIGPADPRRVARDLLERTGRLGARVVTPDDDEWPAQLGDLTKLDSEHSVRWRPPPVCLWVRGKRSVSLAQVLERSVAVVGAREASSYGSHVAAELGVGLVRSGWTVVSGGAYGVDAGAHRGAAYAGGPTVAFLGCGVDMAYPVMHAALFDRIVHCGLLVSEYPPGIPATRTRFARRPGLIAASTCGAVLVEASTSSRARHTLTCALALGRPALVVPGPVTTVTSAGCHHFLRDQAQARPVTDVDEVIGEIERGARP